MSILHSSALFRQKSRKLYSKRNEYFHQSFTIALAVLQFEFLYEAST
jgi:hypothetical protein